MVSTNKFATKQIIIGSNRLHANIIQQFTFSIVIQHYNLFDFSKFKFSFL